jgi:hypothetical protein
VVASALLVVPFEVNVQLDGMTRVSCPMSSYTPPGEALRPSLVRRLLGAKEQLVLASDAVHLVGADGAVHTFRWPTQYWSNRRTRPPR